jgi:hypothetical protein
LEELVQELKERQSGPSSWIWALANNRFLNTMLDATDRHYQLTKGPYSDKFSALRNRIWQARSNQLRGIVVFAIGVIFLLLVGWWHHLRLDQVAVYDGYEQSGEEQVGEARAEKRMSYYDEKISIRKRDWFWALQDRRKAADAQAGKDAFMLWAAEDKQLQASRRHPQRHVAAANYLHTRGAYTVATQAAEVQRVLEDTQSAYTSERQIWKEILTLPIGNPTQCEVKVRRLRGYLQQGEGLSHEEAGTLLPAVLNEWDRQEYAHLAGLIENTRDPKYFSNLELAARAYLREDRHTVFMKEPVRALIRQVEGIKGTKDYSILVQGVTIPKDSDLDGDWRGNPNCSVTVLVGSESRQTNKVKPDVRASDGSFSIVFHQQLKSFRLTGGEYKTVTVTVTTHRTFFTDNVASREVTEETLPLVQMNGPVFVTCKANKAVTVYFECPAASIDRLPAFRIP